MSKVQFEEQTFGPAPNKKGKKPSSIAKLIISTGVAKNEKQANIVMICMIIVLCIISFFALT